MIFFFSYFLNKQKSDSIAKLYDMDENPERKIWLDKLMSYMDDRRTPITACPTISKQALDLYRLYLYVKERGGFVEVCKVSSDQLINFSCILLICETRANTNHLLCDNRYQKVKHGKMLLVC